MQAWVSCVKFGLSMGYPGEDIWRHLQRQSRDIDLGAVVEATGERAAVEKRRTVDVSRSIAPQVAQGLRVCLPTQETQETWV